ncbi:hypothetical protein AB6A40_002831 [Gnathostoma spinigerum]|uniref:Uncharacterized protein n=1 Tax=Gnathostoma spinigerum TaxID=75299 RepID=A0ABD6EA04_9BILA
MQATPQKMSVTRLPKDVMLSRDKARLFANAYNKNSNGIREILGWILSCSEPFGWFIQNILYIEASQFASERDTCSMNFEFDGKKSDGSSVTLLPCGGSFSWLTVFQHIGTF